jgi:Enoyl-(Acyl carrier protein) reductase
VPGIFLTDRQRELRGADAARRGIAFEQVIEEVGRGIPVGRVGQPVDIGALVAFLVSARAGYITGTSIQVDGGLVLGMPLRGRYPPSHACIYRYISCGNSPAVYVKRRNEARQARGGGDHGR